MSALVVRINVYPIKSLDGVAVECAELTPGGALRHDRRWAMRDERGDFINGKREPALHRLRCKFDLAAETVELRFGTAREAETFSLAGDLSPLAGRLSEFLGQPITLVEHRDCGFPDDTAAPGPTVISLQSLQTVATWFDFSLDEARRRFRANLEIDAEAPFWEDRLCASDAQGVAFRVGEVSFLGTNPCARCVVPSRSADAGVPTPLFQKLFSQRRAASLPPWAAPHRFDHFYRLAVNTRITTPAPGAVRVGDAVCIF